MKQQLFKWPAFPLDHFPYEENQTNNLFLITGDSGIGKTTGCRQWIDSVQAGGGRVGGLLSLPVIAGGQKVAIDLVDVAAGERRQLAKLRQSEANLGAVTTGKWLFDTAVLTWGNTVLQRITAVDLLIIDELGPLEFEQGQGLQAAFELIGSGRYRMAGVVIRPSLLPQARQRWPWAQTIPVTREPNP
jgi:nucleoside-triphosphatase THEP1